MIPVTRQTYVDSNFDEAIKLGCNCFQLKYDGWWTRAVFTDGSFTMYSQTGREFNTGHVSSGLNAIVIGEFMQGTQWSQDPHHKGKFYVFDLWEFDGVELTGMSYRDRYAYLKSIKPLLPSWAELVVNYPMDTYNTIWEMFVMSGKFEGVVYRDSHSPVSKPLLRIKRDIEDTYLAVGFEEGIGKHSGRLGAIITDKKTDDGKSATVGGGFSDEERHEIWNNQAAYINRKFDVVGKHRFNSGLLRHPNFIRWKE